MRRLIVSLLVFVAVLLVARLALPSVARSYVNRSLAEMGEYSGRVEDVDIALIRGAYTLRNLRIVKVGATAGPPFLDAAAVDISVDWGALFAGELVGEIEADGPRLNLVQAETDEETQLGSGVNWPSEIRELFPFRFNRVDVTRGTVDFLAPGIESDDALRLADVTLALRNLTNVHEENVDAFAELEFAALFMESAPTAISGHIDPNKELPTFDLNLALDGADVTEVNPWLEEYFNIDAEAGRFSLYAEFAAAEGRFEGYAKPIIEGADIYRRNEEASGPFRRAWEVLVDFGRKVVENEEADQIATQIPFSGEIENPDAGTLVAIVNVLRNGFVAAFSHSLEGTVDLRDVDPEAALDDDATATAP